MEATLFIFGGLIRQQSASIYPQRIYFYFKQKVRSVKSLNYHLACDLAACVPEYSCFNEFPQC